MKSIELFAGAGGLAIGTSRAGFRHEAVIEWDRDACNTLRLNAHAGHGHAGNWSIHECDIAGYDFRRHQGSLEFVSGGPPCQPFSMGGKHGGMADKRNMFPHAVRAVREIEPKAFLFENVKGLLRKNFANYYSYILHQLRYPEVSRTGDEEWTDHLARLESVETSGKYKGLCYNVVFRLLNAADYGVPQHRWRVFIVGVRSDLGVSFSFPNKTHEEDALLYDQWVTGEYWDHHQVPKRERPSIPPGIHRRLEALNALWGVPQLNRWQTVRDAIDDLPSLGMGMSSRKIENHYFNPGARSYPGHTGSSLDEPAKALKAGDHGVPGGENTLRVGDGSVRYFTVRECARIQTFPDEWSFASSWTESMRQLGNAVPVQLAETVAAHLKRTIDRATLVVDRVLVGSTIPRKSKAISPL